MSATPLASQRSRVRSWLETIFPQPRRKPLQYGATIDSAEDTLAFLSTEIARMHAAIQPYKARLEEFKASVEAHRGVLSARRRVTDDVFGEIFQHILDSEPLPMTQLCLMGLVCRRWRNVLLQARFLRNIRLPAAQPPAFIYIAPPPPDIDARSLARGMNSISFQLHKTGSAPVNVDLTSLRPAAFNLLGLHAAYPHTMVVIDLVLLHSERLQKLVLDIWQDHFVHVAKSGCAFPLLQTLVAPLGAPPPPPFTMTQQPPSPDFADRFFASLPALKHLTLKFQAQTTPIPLVRIPWAQLSTCQLEEVRTEDLVQILPRLAMGCRLSLHSVNYRDNVQGATIPVVVSSISALSFNGHREIPALLASLSAPHLTKFAIRYGARDAPVPLQVIVDFLARSDAFLTHLGIQIPDAISIEQLTALLGSKHLRNLVDLDVAFDRPAGMAVSRYQPSLAIPLFLELMRRPETELLARLRTVALAAEDYEILPDVVRDLCRARSGLREVWIGGTENFNDTKAAWDEYSAAGDWILGVDLQRIAARFEYNW
ncbi:hypothetical protein MKEN_01148400 [Mycena kentingensis (nom. inval.)]|nr:hypothetical protein MKEN_01148400 [Mycena kentingensis (nom. inval.)]